jgi:hypothetical protein
VIDSDRRRRSLLISTRRPAASTARFQNTGSSRCIGTGKPLIQQRSPSLFGQRNTALRSDSDASPQVPTNCDTIDSRPPSRSGSRPYTTVRQRRSKRTLLPILQNAFAKRRPGSRRHPRRHHQLASKAASQQFLLFSAATLAILFQHARRPDGSSLHTNVSLVTTSPCHLPPPISATATAPSPSFEE